MIITSLRSEDRIQSLIKNSQNPEISREAQEFLKSLEASDKKGVSKESKRCFKTEKKCSSKEPSEKRGNKSLIVFVSSSMGKESLKTLFQQVSQVGGVLVFQGLIHNSFKETQAYFLDLGITADINPTLFSEKNIKSVPTFLLEGDSDSFDVIEGNISLEAALKLFKDHGDNRDLAENLLKTLERYSA